MRIRIVECKESESRAFKHRRIDEDRVREKSGGHQQRRHQSPRLNPEAQQSARVYKLSGLVRLTLGCSPSGQLYRDLANRTPFRVSAKPSPAVEQQQQQEESSAESAGSQTSSFSDKSATSQLEALVAQDSRSRPAQNL